MRSESPSHARVLRDPVEREAERLDFRVGAVGDDDRGDLATAKLAHDAPDRVSVHEDVVAVNNDRDDLPEPLDQLLELAKLALVVAAGMPGVGRDRANRQPNPFGGIANHDERSSACRALEAP